MHFLDLLPDGYLYCLAFGPDAPNRVRWVEDKAQLLPLATRLEEKGHSVWVAFAGFAEATRRLKTNVAALQTFVFDIDPKEVKGGYATFEEAKTALLAAVQARAILPPTLVVRSGGGLHVYWQLHEPIDAATWTAVATRIRAKLIAADRRLACDTARVVDCCGVMRLPGTMNRKYDPPVPVRESAKQRVYSLANIEAWCGGAPRLLTPPAHARSTVVPLLVERPRTQADGDAVRASCAAFRHYEATQAEQSYTGWYSALQLASYMEDGRRHAHELSEGHDGYDPEAVDAKFAEISSHNNGPMSCTTFVGNLGLDPETVCKGCPLFRAGRRPTEIPQHVRPARAPIEPTDAEGAFEAAVLRAMEGTHHYVSREPEVPAWLDINGTLSDYYLDGFGGLWRKAMADDETQRPVKLASNGFWPIAAYTAGSDAFIEIGFARPTQEGFTTEVVAMPAKLTQDLKVMRMWLAGRGAGLFVGNRAEKMLALYRNEFVQRVEQGDVMRATRFGWTGAAFVCGAIRVAEKALEPCVLSGDAAGTKGVGQMFHQGTIAGAKELLRLYADYGSDAAKFMLAVGFAVPMWKWADEPAMIVHMAGPSGVGKTSLQRCVSSIYGKPVPSHLLGGDSAKGTENVLGCRGELPVILDETTNVDDAFTAQLAMQIGKGQSAAVRRTDGSGQLRDDGLHWSTVVITSGNNSLMDVIARHSSREKAVASQLRTFEVPVTVGTLADDNAVRHAEITARANALLEKHHGMIGLHWLQHIVANRARLREKVRAEKERLVRESSAERRYTNALLAAVFVAVEEMRQLGYWEIDVNLMQKIAAKLLSQSTTRMESAQRSCASVIADYLVENSTVMDRVENGRLHATAAARGSGYKGMQTVAGAVMVVEVPEAALAAYCKAQKIQLSAFLADAASQGILRGDAGHGFKQRVVYRSVSQLPILSYVFELPATPVEQRGLTA